MSARIDSGAAPERHIGLFGATGIGVGAIVGGGILALAGAAFATTGPGAMLAFGLNGMIALLTALSFAEMASKFPESGGTYTFSKKVLSVEAAFAVGWVVWFASIVASVLYAVGFAYFAMVMVSDICRIAGAAPDWLLSPWTVTGVSIVTVIGLAVHLSRKAAGGGDWVNIGKVLVFGVLILGGLWGVLRQPVAKTGATLRPFFTAGFGGLIQAMGYTFIALQGFDLIAAVGGEVREPAKTLPRAMVLSLAIAIVIYLPLLFVITTCGTAPGESIAVAAAADPEGIVATAAERFLGPLGYWLVIVAAVLSMFSALQANLFAASRIAQSMARDQTLPSILGRTAERYGTPMAAIIVTAAVTSALLLALDDVAAAGAASSLMFLITFGLAHWIAILVRQRSARRPPPFQTPLFPFVPVVGGLACIALAVFQGIAVPSAGIVTVMWLTLGGALFLALFARSARLTDVANTAFEPELVTLRGRSPLVLVPIANPRNADAMIALADALVPGEVGRVLAHTVAVASDEWLPDDQPAPLENSQSVLREILRASARSGIGVETLTTRASHAMQEIARVARLHRCESVLLGLSRISDDNRGSDLESLLGALDANVIVLRSREDWRLADARRILVPVAGRGGHEHLLAQLLGSLLRDGAREVTFLRILPASSRPDDVRRAERDLAEISADNLRRASRTEIVRSDDPLGVICERAGESDLLMLGVQRHGRRKKLFGDFTREISRRTSCPLIIMSRAG